MRLSIIAARRAALSPRTRGCNLEKDLTIATSRTICPGDEASGEIAERLRETIAKSFIDVSHSKHPESNNETLSVISDLRIAAGAVVDRWSSELSERWKRRKDGRREGSLVFKQSFYALKGVAFYFRQERERERETRILNAAQGMLNRAIEYR